MNEKQEIAVPADKIPVRLCCGQRHWTVTCPDGKVMCCICFSRFAREELHADDQGQRWNICIPCEKHNEDYRSAHPEAGKEVLPPVQD